MDIVAVGATIGMANALLAMGLVLIYMSNRVINLAHGELGAFAVAMMLALTRNAHLNYWLALLLSLGSAGALAAFIERSIIRRLIRSPRLIVLIATLGVAQAVIVARLILPKPRVRGQKVFFGGSRIFPLPFHFTPVQFRRVVLGPEHLICLIVGPLLAIGIFVFLRYTSYGIALRAAAQNMPRARLLGIPVMRVSTIAWAIGGITSGAAGVLLAPIIGYSSGEAVGLPLLMRGLAAAVVARMESVGVAFGVGLGLGVIDQLLFFWTGRSGLTDMVLLGVIVVTLLARRPTTTRTLASEESSWETSDPVRALPVEVAAHTRWRTVMAAAAVCFAAIVVLAPLPLGESTTFFLSTVSLVAVVAVSATVLTGWAGQMSLGQWALAGVGGVFGAKLVVSLNFSFGTAFLVATAMGGAIALLLGLPSLRLEGTALAVTTLGFAVAASSWLFDQSWFKGSGFMTRPTWLTSRAYYGISLALLLATVLAARTFQRKRVGRNMIAVRDNPMQAAALGVSAVKTKLTAFVFAGVVAAAAGFLWSAGNTLADQSVFGPVRSLSIMAAVVIGGVGSIPGAIIGVFYLLAVPYFLGHVWSYAGLFATAVGVLVLILTLPGGLARLIYGGRDLLARAVTGVDVRPKVEGRR